EREGRLDGEVAVQVDEAVVLLRGHLLRLDRLGDVVQHPPGVGGHLRLRLPFPACHLLPLPLALACRKRKRCGGYCFLGARASFGTSSTFGSPPSARIT